MVHRYAGGILFHKVAIARLLDESCDTIHGPGEGFILPPVAVWRPILDRGYTVRIGHKLESVSALGTEAALVDGAFRIALDVNDLSLLGEDKEAAADGTIRA